MSTILDGKVYFSPAEVAEHASDKTAPLLAEIERLKADRNGWLAANSPGGWIDDLRAQLEAARKDAERYRWLRDPNSPVERVCMDDGLIGVGETLDKAIDAARAEKP